MAVWPVASLLYLEEVVWVKFCLKIALIYAYVQLKPRTPDLRASVQGVSGPVVLSKAPGDASSRTMRERWMQESCTALSKMSGGRCHCDDDGDEGS